MAPKKKRPTAGRPAHEFSIEWNPDRTRFDIYRDKERTPSFAGDKSTAIGLAIREARMESRATGLIIIVTSVRDGSRVIEWDGIS